MFPAILSSRSRRVAGKLLSGNRFHGTSQPPVENPNQKACAKNSPGFRGERYLVSYVNTVQSRKGISPLSEYGGGGFYSNDTIKITNSAGDSGINPNLNFFFSPDGVLISHDISYLINAIEIANSAGAGKTNRNSKLFTGEL